MSVGSRAGPQQRVLADRSSRPVGQAARPEAGPDERHPAAGEILELLRGLPDHQHRSKSVSCPGEEGLAESKGGMRPLTMCHIL